MALTAELLFAVPHMVFHITHLEHFPLADAIAQTTVFAVTTAVLIALLVLAAQLGNTDPPSRRCLGVPLGDPSVGRRPWRNGAHSDSWLCFASLEHHVEADEPMLGVVECLRDSGEDLEAQRLPQVDGGAVGLNDRVELDAVVTGGASPVEDVAAQRSTYSSTLVIWVDHEAARRDVRSSAGPVRAHLG